MTEHSPDRPATPLSGVAMTGTGSAVPKRLVTNADLEKLMDTSDEWIVQRTGIRSRYVHDPEQGESSLSLGVEASVAAVEAAGIDPSALDLIAVGTMTPDMATPSVACMLADRLGAGQIAAYDLNAACSGFVYALNTAHALMLGGQYKHALVVGVDCITQHCDFSTYGRAQSVLFGDAAGACVLSRTDDTSKGMLAHAMHSDGGGAKSLFIPSCERTYLASDEFDERKVDKIVMNGASVFKFAVGKFPKLLGATLEQAGLEADDVDHFICHQSNARILNAARERFDIPSEKLYVNIDRYGNTVGASVPLILDQQTRAGRIKPGDCVMFLAFGAGLTWASSLWQF